ncbi:hypothetical protein HGP28_11745 [Vibrio sp. SM6]|uniref:PhoP regulatory network protein YrbL n=1 Tax=Vibrio agarilyticus TaxID=2726741 RepID=A0A7X8TRJ8_9VIBR|nr:YrbL family protein [Vibrio agarilyticus]NLS13565.1 hypothetical protein [Vibrio agarilyticus]
MITLLDNSFIAKGSERACYKNPENEEQCIKVYWHRKRKRNESKQEMKYSKRHLKNIEFIAKPICWVNTNLGKGLTFPLIKDYDGRPSKTLAQLISSLNYSELANKLIELKRSLIDNNISITDLPPQNICCKFKNELEYDLIIIDGFGYSNIIPVAYFSKSLLRKQIIKRFDRHLAQLMRIV